MKTVIIYIVVFTLSLFNQTYANTYVKSHIVHQKHHVKSKEEKKKDDLLENAKLVANHRYDKLFIANAGNVRYNSKRMLKSVCATESKLKPNALSKVGALGLCQLMPGTWKHVMQVNKSIPKDGRNNPQHSISAASLLLSELDLYWKDVPDGIDKQKLILASYNAGSGNIRKATKHCKDISYTCVEKHLPNVTSKRNALETTQFVARVESLYSQISL